MVSNEHGRVRRMDQPLKKAKNKAIEVFRCVRQLRSYHQHRSLFDQVLGEYNFDNSDLLQNQPRRLWVHKRSFMMRSMSTWNTLTKQLRPSRLTNSWTSSSSSWKICFNENNARRRSRPLLLYNFSIQAWTRTDNFVLFNDKSHKFSKYFQRPSFS